MCKPRASSPSQEAEEARAKLLALAASSGGCLINKNLEGIVTGWDRRAEQLFGYRATEIIGRPMLLLTPADRQAQEAAILERVRQGRSVEPYDTVRKTRGGRRIAVSVTLSPVLNGAGVIEVVRAASGPASGAVLPPGICYSLTPAPSADKTGKLTPPPDQTDAPISSTE